MCVCVCVCERERESACVLVGEGVGRESVCVCVSGGCRGGSGERECVCVLVGVVGEGVGRDGWAGSFLRTQPQNESGPHNGIHKSHSVQPLYQGTSGPPENTTLSLSSKEDKFVYLAKPAKRVGTMGGGGGGGHFDLAQWCPDNHRTTASITPSTLGHLAMATASSRQQLAADKERSVA